MGNAVQTEKVIRFQDFQINLETGELWRAGVRLKLQDQPFKVLTTLVQRPGQVVTREELRQLIWPQESFGDLDHAINLAVTKLRNTLGDSADVPHLIETLPRRGYRFIASVEPTATAKHIDELPAKTGFLAMLPRLISRAEVGWFAIGATTTLLVGILVGYLVTRSSRPLSSLQVTRTVIKLEPGHVLDGFRLSPPFGLGQPTETGVAISSDGNFIVYSAIREKPEPQEKPQLYLRRIGESDSKPIPGTQGGICPFLSPDDRWVGFWADNKLMKVSMEGGVPVFLSKDPVQLWRTKQGAASDVATANWGPGNKIVFSAGIYGHLVMVSADGGTPEILSTPDRRKGEFSHCLPHWLPDGKSVFFTILRDWFDEHPLVAVLDLKARKWRVLLEDAADARYLPTGHLVFLRQGTLMVVPFDVDRREVRGLPVPAIANVMQAFTAANETNTAAGQFSISNSGSLVYAAGGINPERQDSLVWVDMKGNATPITSFTAPFWAPRLSPDGQRITYITAGREWHAWVYDLHRDTASELIGDEKVDFAQWTPDGKGLVFKGWRAGEEANLYLQPVDGSSAAERLTTSDNHQVPGSFTPNGDTLAFSERDLDTKWSIQLLDMKSRRVTPFQESKGDELDPEFSPDGRWIAYVGEQLYVKPYPGPRSRFQVTLAGGWSPLWARNGKQLFYMGPPTSGGPNVEYWVVDVRSDASFSASKPRLLFKSADFRCAGPSKMWDISPDGQRFLMVKFNERKPQPVTELILVQNWFEELKRLVPTKK